MDHSMHDAKGGIAGAGRGWGCAAGQYQDDEGSSTCKDCAACPDGDIRVGCDSSWCLLWSRAARSI